MFWVVSIYNSFHLANVNYDKSEMGKNIDYCNNVVIAMTYILQDKTMDL